MKLIIGMIGMLIASALLTWSTQPSQFAPVPSKRKRKRKTTIRLQDMQPSLTDEGRVVMNPRRDEEATSPGYQQPSSLTHEV